MAHHGKLLTKYHTHVKLVHIMLFNKTLYFQPLLHFQIIVYVIDGLLLEVEGLNWRIFLCYFLVCCFTCIPDSLQFCRTHGTDFGVGGLVGEWGNLVTGKYLYWSWVRLKPSSLRIAWPSHHLSTPKHFFKQNAFSCLLFYMHVYFWLDNPTN